MKFASEIMMMQKVLIVDNNDSFTYNLKQLVHQCESADYKIISTDHLKKSSVQNFNKILISPGPGIPEEYPQLLDIIDYFASKKSILGICLGHQAINVCFGGKLKQLDRIIHGESSIIKIVDHQEILFKNIASGFSVCRYHSWMVDPNQIAQGIKITAEDEQSNIMAIAHQKYDVKGVQFHPESIMTQYGAKIIYNWLNTKH